MEETKITKFNEVKITGKIANLKHETLPSGKLLSKFGLSVWMGKKDGKNVYEYINCDMWDEHLVVTDGDKDVTGSLKVNSWTDKEGKKQTRVFINVKSVVDSEDSPKTSPVEVKSTPELDDDLPF